MRHLIYLLPLATLYGCVGNEHECQLPSTAVKVKLTSIVSSAEFKLDKLDVNNYAVRFTTYDPRDGKRLYTATGKGLCRDQQFSAEFTSGELEKPELIAVGGKFNGIFSRDPFGKHYGEWAIKVEQLGPIEPLPFKVQEAYGKRYIEDKGMWALQ